MVELKVTHHLHGNTKRKKNKEEEEDKLLSILCSSKYAVVLAVLIIKILCEGIRFVIYSILLISPSPTRLASCELFFFR